MKALSITFDKNTRLYVVFPHPDDELFGCGGLVQHVLSKGGSVWIDVLSCGEASTLRHGLLEHEDLASARELEFKNVCRELGVVTFGISRVIDGGMKDQQVELGAFIRDRLMSFNPTYVVTYEPCGVYGHSDHIAVSKYVTELHTEKLDFTLLYSTVPSSFKIPQENLIMAEDPSAVKPAEPNFLYKLSFREFARKIHCFGMYKSQVKPSKNIIENLYPNNANFSIDDIMTYLNQNPDLFLINSEIQQKKVTYA